MREVRIVMNGVTGRMGSIQHLDRSIMAMVRDGGVLLESGERVMPVPILVGRNEQKLADLADHHGIGEWTTDLAGVISAPETDIVFDAASTQLRKDIIAQAIAAGKPVYCEKPSAENYNSAIALADLAENAGVANGVVQDKLFLPGIRKLKSLIDAGFFGRILDVRIDFGYWVFEGGFRDPQRPSWNYRAEDGGGIILDMWPHWEYVISHLFGSARSMTCHGTTHIPQRFDERGEPYAATADDAAYALLTMDSGAVIQIASSWCTRVDRRDLVTFHVNGVEGSAVAGLTNCVVQSAATTPRPVWNPDEMRTQDFTADWTPVLTEESYGNGFKEQWVAFLNHVLCGTDYQWDLRKGAAGVLFADKAIEAWKTQKWIDLGDG